jgi:Trypsin
MLARRILMAAAVVAHVATASAWAAGPRLQPRIVNGEFTAQHPTVAALLIGANAETAAQHCTATLIGCQTILTAAHCVCDAEGSDCQPGQAREPRPGRYFVFLQHAGTFAVDRIVVHPDYRTDVADIAVLHISTPVTGIAPTPINRTGSPPHGMTGTVVGFGRQGGAVSDYGLKRTGTVTLDACANGISSEHSVCWTFDAPGGAPGTNSNTCHGDSGGPLFVDYGCGPIVAGVTTDGRNADCSIGDQSWDANVFTYRGFIDAAAPGDLDRDACGPGPQVGDPSVEVASQVGTLGPSLPDEGFTIAVPLNTAELRVTLSGVDTPSVFENFDLKLRLGERPTDEQFDCWADGSSQFAECIVANPTPGIWHALAGRVSGSGTYQLTATTLPIAGTNPRPAARACNDGSLCTAHDTCRVGQCVGTPTPLTSCHRPTGRARSRLVVENPSNDRRDTMHWTTTRLPIATTELGDPRTETDYEICVFDTEDGAPQVALDMRIPAGAGWKKTRRGLTFRDKSASNGGIRALRLTAGRTTGSIRVRGAGLNLPTPELPLVLDPRVRIQIGNGSACWEADFSRTRQNRSGQFRAKSD